MWVQSVLMKSDLITDEVRYRLLKKIEKKPNISQRELARSMGVSLGKVNYCLKALIEAGFVKAGNFARSNNKKGYVYVLTPKGVKEKTAVAIRFLEKKMEQRELLIKEIEQLREEIASK